MNYRSIGLEDRDRVNHAIGGGFPEGSLVLLEGGTGAGKSALASRVVYGLCEEGSRVALASTEGDVGSYLEQMHSLSYDVLDHLLAGRLRYFHVPLERERALVERFLRPGALWDADVVVADGFGALCRNDPAFAAALGTPAADRAMERVVARLDAPLDAGRVVLLTVDPAALSEAALRPLHAAADVYLSLQTDVVGQDVRKKAVVRRFAGMRRPVDDTIGFSVKQGRGLVIESRTIA
ncbi:flagellar protein FlaH [Halarchaeum solikamskense]|uniref:ATPase domain-containing protein n=1 Tax=Halarchaeum nitratireducens TaxID=489913 RepID=UPI001B3AC075|nr:flagellar protein FlaH [Halarchaeum solikamskense]